MLSTIAHGHEPGSEAIGLAALASCSHLDNHRTELYADLVMAHLSEVARNALEALMAQHNYTYQSEFARKYVAQGLEQGIEQGQRAILRAQLEKRFGPLSDALAARLEKADSQALARWSLRVLDADTAAGVMID